MTEESINNLFNQFSTDGDDRSEHSASRDLERLITALVDNPNGKYRFKKFSGMPGEKLKEFMSQFRPFRTRWDVTEVLIQIEDNLEGKALKWFKWAKDDIFKNLSEFESEFYRKFNADSESVTDQLLEKLKTFHLSKGQIEEGLLEILTLQKQTTLGLKEVIKAISSRLPGEAIERLSSHRTAKAVMEEAVKLDKIYERNNLNHVRKQSARAEKPKGEQRQGKKILVDKRETGIPNNIRSEQKQGQGKKIPAGGLERKVPKHIKCFTCQGNHYATTCPENQSLRMMATATVAKGPTIEVQIGAKPYPILLDTGASANFMAKELVEQIGFHFKPERKVIVLGQGEAEICGSTRVNIESANGKNSLEVAFLIMEGLSAGIIIVG